MGNKTVVTTRVINTTWIILEPDQRKLLHDEAYRLSEHLEATEYKSKAKFFYDISDRVQRNNRISMKQLAAIQWGMWFCGLESLYVRGLEYWLLQNMRKMEKKKKQYLTNGIKTERYHDDKP